MVEYNRLEPWKTLDVWQRDALEWLKDPTNKNLCIVSGRQCGKSTIVSIMVAEEAINVPNSYIVIGAYVLEQTELIFWKIKAYIEAKYKNQIIGRMTLHFLQLKNGSKIFCRAVGDTGGGMRGPTATMIVLDEASLIPDRAWVAIEPMISVSKGRIIVLSTPQGKRGFFYEASINEEYKQFRVSARDCPRHTKKFLDKKQSELSPIAFATEYLGEFIDDYNRKFSEEWIDKVCVEEKTEVRITGRKYVLGVDVAGEGPDDTTFEIFDATNKKNIFQVDNIFSPKISGPDIERQIENLKSKYYFGRKSIGFDSGGMGSGVFKYMLDNNKIKRCMVSLDNATRPFEPGVKGGRRKLLKEYMYDTLEEAGWRGELNCLNDSAVKQSFRSIQTEFKTNGDRRYWGTYNHIVEGIVRAAWVGKDKGLNIFFYTS